MEEKGKGKGEGALVLEQIAVCKKQRLFSATHRLRSKFLWCAVWRRSEIQFPASGPSRCDCTIRGLVRHELPAAVCVV